MYATIELSRSDIAGIIAEKYGVLMSNVSVNAEETTVGYGPGEHLEYVASATVTLSREKMEERGWV